MPREPRKFSATGLYHIILRGVGKQIIFESDEDRFFFLRTTATACGEEGAQILAWCLMSNHVHLLIKTEEAPGRLMKRVNTKYAKYFNEKYERSGHFFQDRFKSMAIEDEAYLVTVIRYIHQNPVREGICETCAEYRWSSYLEYVSKPEICDTAETLSAFGGVRAFEEAHKIVVSIAERPDRSRVKTLSDDELVKEIEAVIGENMIHKVKGFEREKRDGVIVRLNYMGLPIRRIERLTGIGYGAIVNVVRKHAKGQNFQ